MEKTYKIVGTELVETTTKSRVTTKTYTKERVEELIVRNFERNAELKAMLELFK